MTDHSPEFEEGRKAAAERKHCSDHCPYLFGELGVTQREFDDVYRKKNDDWFAGWQQGLRDNGLTTEKGFIVIADEGKP